MRVLITGASGVIGLNLISEFIEAYGTNYQIFAQHTREIPPKILLEIDPNSQVIHVKNISDVVGELKFDLIINASGVSQPSLFVKDPESIVQSNINDPLVLFYSLATYGTFIQMSTSEIYSGCENRPCAEDHRGLIDGSNPRRIYMITKEISELALKNVASLQQTVLIMRVSLVYGKYYLPPDERVLYSFVEQALGGVINPKGGLNNIRRYLHSHDLFRYLQELREKLSGGFYIFNVGSEEKITIAELASLIAKLSDSKLIFGENQISQSGAPNEVWVDTRKLQKFTNLQPTIALEEGLTKVIRWRKNLTL